jgi:hypothetical protein
LAAFGSILHLRFNQRRLSGRGNGTGKLCNRFQQLRRPTNDDLRSIP